jgi:hypothetical protein
LANDVDGDGNPDVKQLFWASAVETSTDEISGIDNFYGAGRIDGLAAMTFLTKDVSSSKSNAYYLGFNPSLWSRTEPMWRLDQTNREDWYKFYVDVYSIVTVTVNCHPDLMVRVDMYKSTTRIDYDLSSYRGDNCYTSYKIGIATMYVKVSLIGPNGVQGYPGDWYDITIKVTPLSYNPPPPKPPPITIDIGTTVIL